MLRRSALLSLAGLSGCGFELRREPVLPFQTLALEGFEPDSPLAAALSRQVQHTPCGWRATPHAHRS